MEGGGLAVFGWVLVIEVLGERAACFKYVAFRDASASGSVVGL